MSTYISISHSLGVYPGCKLGCKSLKTPVFTAEGTKGTKGTKGTNKKSTFSVTCHRPRHGTHQPPCCTHSILPPLPVKETIDVWVWLNNAKTVSEFPYYSVINGKFAGYCCADTLQCHILLDKYRPID